VAAAGNRRSFLLDTVRLANLAYDPLQILPIFIHHAGPAVIFIGLALPTLWKRFRTVLGSGGLLSGLRACYDAGLARADRRARQYVLEFLVVMLLYLCEPPACR